MTLPPTDQPAAPGVTKEVEDLVDDYGDARARLKRWVLDGNVRRCETAGNEVAKTRTALLAAIEKYGKERELIGYRDGCEQAGRLR